MKNEFIVIYCKGASASQISSEQRLAEGSIILFLLVRLFEEVIVSQKTIPLRSFDVSCEDWVVMRNPVDISLASFVGLGGQKIKTCST